MLRRILLVCAIASALSVPAMAQPKELLQLKGQPVQPVIDKLGTPQAQGPAANGTTYAWTLSFMVDAPARVTRNDYGTGRANSYETTEMRRRRMTCALRLTADATGTISDVEAQGPFQACSEVVDKLQGRN